MTTASSLPPPARAGVVRILSWLVFVVLLHAAAAGAQGTPAAPATPVWVDQVHTTGYEYATALVVHSSGVYLATNGNDGLTITPVYVRKYEAGGDLVWVETLATGTPHRPALWADDAGVCVAGATKAKLDGDPPEEFAYGAGFVRCLDADGAPQWTTYIEALGRVPQVAVLGLAGAEDALYVVGATSDSLKDCGLRGCVSYGGWDAFIQRYSRAGVLEWTREFGTTRTDSFDGVAVDPSGTVNAWGRSYYTAPSFDLTIQLARYDERGTLSDTATIPLGPQVLYDAGFAGSTFCLASQQPDPGAASGVASDLRRYEWKKNAQLELGWSESLPDTWVNEVVALPSGLLIAGQAYPPLPGQEGAGYYDGFVRRYDGDLESWTIQFGTPESDEASAVAQDASRIFVAGSTGGTMAAGPDGAAPGDTDAYVARLAEPFSAEAGGPYSVDEGSTVTLSASATAVDYGQTLTYAWDLDGDATAFGAPGQSVAYTAGDDGQVTVRVRVTDDYSEGSAEAAATITVANVAPIVDAGPDVVLELGQALSRQVVFTDPGADSWTATIQYSEVSGSDVQPLSERSFTLAHPYAAAGTYTVTVTVTDEDGGTGTDTLGVVVYGATVTIADLIAAVELLVEQGVLSQGRGNSLVVKGEAAQAALDAGGMQAAVESLRAFVNEVKALENAGILGEQQAEDLVDLAKAVIAAT